MTIQLKYISLILYLIIFLSFLSCNSKENKKEEEAKNEVNEYENIVFTTEEFIKNISFLNFEKASLFCDNISKSSVKKLYNFSQFKNSTRLEEIDTCFIDKNTAYCNCVFTNDENLKFEKKLHLKKYDKEWYVHFLLDENFDNIFVYDYSYEKMTKNSNVSLALSEVQKEIIENIFTRINSNDFVIDFTGIDYLKTVDTGAIEITNTSLKSVINDGDLKIESIYYFEYDVLYDLLIDIYTKNHLDYYQAFIDVAVEKLGMPFNLPENISQKDLSSFKTLRWFVKSHNEIIALNFYNNYIGITLQQIP